MSEPTDTTQSTELKIRITPELKAVAKDEAEMMGFTLSEYIRSLILLDNEYRKVKK